MLEIDAKLTHLREFFSLCADVLCVLDADGGFQLANPALCDLVGVGEDGISGQPFLDLVDEADRSETAAHISKLRRSGGTLRFSNRLRARDGSIRTIAWRAQARKGAELLYLLGTDLTEVQRSEDRFRESELRVNALFDNASQGIITSDREGRVQTMNPMAEKLFGYSRRELVGRSIDALVPGQLREIHASHRKDYFENPRTRPMGLGLELLARRKDGTEFPVEISLSTIHAKEGPIAVAFVSDITERRKALSEKERLEHRLEHATKMEAVGRLAGGIAHDFNNLLTALSGFSEIVLDEVPEDHPLREGAEETLKTCQRSAALVRQLLAVSRRQMFSPQPMDLNAKIGEIEKMLRSLLGEDVELVVSLDPALSRVKADESQIEQVILNLVVNARDAMPTGGRLVIETRNVFLDENLSEREVSGAGTHARISVSDTGEGMDEETLEHMFEPFFTTKAKGKGTGLGLATVYGIVKQSGGHVWAESEPSRGTVFKVYLPRLEPGSVSRPSPRDVVRGQRGSETVLVVEDENTVRLVAVNALRKAGYDVLEARDGEEALELAEGAGPIDLVVTDVVMPRMNGPELLAQLASRHPEPKALFMSGHADDALVHHGIREGKVAFLEKPFSRNDLLTKVREVLDA